jgi:hypothetical protein
MANATVLSPGQVNGVGATDALFLKVFGGEVLTAFETATVTKDKHMVRQIQNGKSAQFPATWKVNASYHTPGAEIVGQASNVNERVITIDDLLIADVFLSNIDEAKNHYDVRSIYSKETGNVLANTWDKNILQLMVLAARASATVTGAFGGTTLTSATTLYKTSATDLAAGIYAGVQAMDEKDIPESDTKSVFVKPAQYYLLAQSTQLINRDWMGAGSYSDGKILRIGGAEIVKTNHLPTTNVITGPTAYQGDFTLTAAVITTKAAVGTVKLLDMAQEMAYDIRRQGTLIVSKYAVGHGVLRPECAVELKTTS